MLLDQLVDQLHELPTRHEPRFELGSLVRKRAFTIPALELESGRVLRGVQIGYETYGNLNDAGDNAVMICHYFTGTSHCAGRYQASDPEPGYWDVIIGPGKAIDTDRYFVVSTDTLCNVNAKNPLVVTTGPLSINPDTGRPYGADFPTVTIGDFVLAQKALADALGIKRFQAVAGPSMGSFQAMEWAARFPQMVDRVICAIPGGIEVEPYLIATLDTWTSPVKLDPQFRNGLYLEQGVEPLEGLAHAVKLVTLSALHYDWAQRLFRRRWADRERDPALELDNRFSIEESLYQSSKNRARGLDANSFLRVIKAVQTFSIAGRKRQLRSSFLFIPAKSDLLLFPRYAQRGVEQLRELGLEVELFEIEGAGGHLDGLNEIKQAAPVIRNFLR